MAPAQAGSSVGCLVTQILFIKVSVDSLFHQIWIIPTLLFDYCAIRINKICAIGRRSISAPNWIIHLIYYYRNLNAEESFFHSFSLCETPFIMVWLVQRLAVNVEVRGII